MANNNKLPFQTVNNIVDAELYDTFQIREAAAIKTAYGTKSSFEDVWNALSALWVSNADIDPFEDSRNEHLTAALHGWALEEVYAVASIDTNTFQG